MAVPGCEYLSVGGTSSHALSILTAMQSHSGDPGQFTGNYVGNHDWLMLWGAGRPAHAQAWRQHLPRPVVMWDLGYLGRGKGGGYYRVSVNEWHPTPEQIQRTRPDPERWERLGVTLRDDFNAVGPIVLIGMGPKSRQFLGDVSWERRTLESLRERFPGRKVIFRPKPRRPVPHLSCPTDRSSSIEDAIRGASLVVCRHSNASVDAVIAGVPFECEEGAAKWLDGQPYTAATRLDFLQRLACWQYRADEALEAWRFLRKVIR